MSDLAVSASDGKMGEQFLASLDVPLLSATDLSEWRKQAQGSHQSVYTVISEELAISPAAALARVAATLKMTSIDMAGLHVLVPDFESLPYPEAVRRQCLIAQDVSGQLIGVLSDPFDLSLQSWLATQLAKTPAWQLALPADLAAALNVHEEKLRALDSVRDTLNHHVDALATAEEISLTSISRDSSPVVRLVNSTIFDAMNAMASDIHWEATAQGLQIRYRIDGVLTQVMQVPGRENADQVVSRIKVLAELDIAERRIPQDGRFKLSVKNHLVDFRVSVMPSLFGEDVVIRILDKRGLTDQFQGLRLDFLGFDEGTLTRIRKLAREPYGMLLVTGPTGSGKTTTLYAALSEINDGRDKLMTIEDPIEYQLPGILQIPVNEKKGLTFARGLRSILRHDPDKILVGEIRDSETAQIAIQSALTGHLVLTSVHANNVFDVLGRFLHMGVDTYSFVSALNGILAQRLVRLICPECVTADSVPSSVFENSSLSDQELEMLCGAQKQLLLKRGRGCGHCRGTGYKGRHAIGEILRLNDEIRELIIARAPIRTIKEAARVGGTRFLRESAVAMALAGRTTLEEINRVTFAD